MSTLDEPLKVLNSPPMAVIIVCDYQSWEIGNVPSCTLNQVINRGKIQTNANIANNKQGNKTEIG